MESQRSINYRRVATAIEFIAQNFKHQPTLDAIAEKVNLSPFHFQRLFKDWAGVSPKTFLQYTTIEFAKHLLQDRQVSLFDVAEATGLSGTSRLHDLFVKIEGMTPAEYKYGGINLAINYSFIESPFGDILVGSTHKGICHMAFADSPLALEIMKSKFPNAQYSRKRDNYHEMSQGVFSNDWQDLQQVKLHLKGTAFQVKVWEMLLKIPLGKLATYGSIAKNLNRPDASRAVGTAIGSNPISYLIPCHRVIRSGGALGGYMWGVTRKKAMIGWEAAQTRREENTDKIFKTR